MLMVLGVLLLSPPVTASSAEPLNQSPPDARHVVGVDSNTIRSWTRFEYTSDLSDVAIVSLGMLQETDQETTDQETDEEPTESFTSADVRRAHYFGEKGSWRFNVVGSYAVNFAASDITAGGFGFTYFFKENISIDFVVDGGFYDQPGPTTAGVSFSLLFRWHFVTEPGWSFFVDGGAGFLKTSDDVPSGGSNFNFTPQVGVGFTFDVGNDWRAMVGARWMHISNANFSDANPGRDDMQLWAGLSIPF